MLAALATADTRCCSLYCGLPSAVCGRSDTRERFIPMLRPYLLIAIFATLLASCGGATDITQQGATTAAPAPTQAAQAEETATAEPTPAAEPGTDTAEATPA